MSLRFRLTVVYTTLLALIIIVLGYSVYLQLDATLIQQIETRLNEAMVDMVSLLEINEAGNIRFSSFAFLDPSLTIQYWEDERTLTFATDQITDLIEQSNPVDFNTTPLDSAGLSLVYRSQNSINRIVQNSGSEYLVHTFPVKSSEGRLVGAIQAGISLDEVRQLERSIIIGLLITGVLAIGVSSWLGYVLSQRALSPLHAMTTLAADITSANDLSRRIPTDNISQDEVGILVNTFNQTMARLEQLFESQRKFLADVGHELRTPLTVIRGNADLMRKMGEMNETSLKGMEDEIDRMSRMVNDLLLLAQADAGEIPLIFEPVELDTILLEVNSYVRVLAGSTKKVIIKEIDQIVVCGDKDRLKQVILNIYTNAIQHAPDDSEITICLGKENGHAYLSITDQGHGIPPEELEHVFNRFYRLEKSRHRTSKSKGYGLGLSISDLIIKNHGGYIKAESILDQATTFTIYLPLDQPPCN